MKNIIDILKGIGIEIPEDKAEEFNKSFNSNYKTINEVTALNTKLSTLQSKYNEDIKNRDDDLATLKTQLADAGTDKDKLEKLTTKFNTLQSDYDTAKADYEKKLSEQEYKHLVNENANALKFSSNSAKRAFIEDVTAKNLVVENGQLMGFNDFVEQYKKADAGAFVEETSTTEESKKPQFVAKTTQINKPTEEQKEIPKVW